MLNKIFFVLLFLSVAGAVTLWWLSKKIEQSAPTHVLEPPAQTDQVEGSFHGQTVGSAESVTEKENNLIDESHEQKSARSKLQVLIQTQPVSAEIYIDNVFMGKAPMKISLKDTVQKLEVRAEGYESFSRLIPTYDESDMDLSWKIALSRKPSSKKSTARSNAPSVATEHTSKNRFYVQVKAFAIQTDPLTVEQLKGLLNEQKYNVKSCVVNLGDKGQWLRVLVGPYDNKKQAQSVLAKLKVQDYTDAFVAGEGQCP